MVVGATGGGMDRAARLSASGPLLPFHRSESFVRDREARHGQTRFIRTIRTAHAREVGHAPREARMRESREEAARANAAKP